MRFSPLVDRIAGRGAGAWNIHFEAVRRREAGEDVILLTVGDPDQAPPAAVIDAAVDGVARQRTGYAPTIGYPAVREAIAARVARRTGQPCAADNVASSPGAQGGLYCARAMPRRPGRRGHRARADLRHLCRRGRRQRRARWSPCHCGPRRGFHPDLDALAAAVTPRTRVVWINSPHNPTGAVFTARGDRRPSPRCAAGTICGCCPTRFTKTSPLPGRMSAPGRCRHGRAHGRRLQPVEIARDARLPPRLGGRARRHCRGTCSTCCSA